MEGGEGMHSDMMDSDAGTRTVKGASSGEDGGGKHSSGDFCEAYANGFFHSEVS